MAVKRFSCHFSGTGQPVRYIVFSKSRVDFEKHVKGLWNLYVNCENDSPKSHPGRPSVSKIQDHRLATCMKQTYLLVRRLLSKAPDVRAEVASGRSTRPNREPPQSSKSCAIGSRRLLAFKVQEDWEGKFAPSGRNFVVI